MARSVGVAMAVLGAIVLSFGPSVATAVEPLVAYGPPVDAPVTDPFRPPTSPYGPGNRGLEYALTPDTPVRAAADGEVVFAGVVAGTRHVTILHADGLRTSYSYLATVDVRAGQRIGRGHVVGVASNRLHFGVRDAAGTYLDPALLFDGEPVARARLVPGTEEGRPPLQAAERAAFVQLVLEQARGRLPLVLHYATELRPDVRVAHVIERIGRQTARQSSCTSASVAPDGPAGRRIVVLVGGLGSTGERAAVDRVDTAALGVAAADVVRFSYAGGRVPDATDGASFAVVEARPYAAVDTYTGLQVAADRLLALVRAVAAAEPGVPIDLIAHSQGGVVARLALSRAEAELPDELASLATLAAPFGGADLATAADAARGLPPAARSALDAAGHSPDAPSIRQLSEISALVHFEHDSPVPDRIARVSIAARGDLVVPTPRSLDDEFPSAIVDLGGPQAHDQLPGSAATTRELALVRSGRPPTCRSPGDLVVDAVVGEGASWATDALGGLLLAAGAPN